MTSKANREQVGGDHYKAHGLADLQHWDIVDIFRLDYFQGNITKYVMRWKQKGGIEDLKKARHYLDKYIEIKEGRLNLARDPLSLTDEEKTAMAEYGRSHAERP